MTDERWTLVIPVKGSDGAKSRLDHPLRHELARAMAIDTVATALATPAVEHVVIVTPRKSATPFAALGAHVVSDPGSGLAAAIRAGLAEVGPDHHRAVLLGDLPALQPRILSAGLRHAARFPRGFVRDAAKVGTTLLTARAGYRHSPAFGGASALAHLHRGYRELPIARGSGLRADIDTVDDLSALDPSALGVRTRQALSRL